MTSNTTRIRWIGSKPIDSVFSRLPAGLGPFRLQLFTYCGESLFPTTKFDRPSLVVAEADAGPQLIGLVRSLNGVSDPHIHYDRFAVALW